MPLDPNAPHSGITYQIIGAAFTVHTALKAGYREVLYQNAMEVELAQRGLHFEREYRVEVYYKDQPIGLYFLDFFVEDAVVVELKAFPHMMTREDEAQCLRYMRVTDSKVGLLLNFGRNSLEKTRKLLTEDSPHPYNPATDQWLRTEGYKQSR